MGIEGCIKDITFLQTKGNCVENRQILNVLVRIMETNNNGCEMILSLFIAALNSYKSGKCLKPFPPSFVENGIEDVTALRELCDTIPSLEEFKSCPESYSNKITDLFSWLFIEKAFPLLEEVPFESIVLNENIAKNFQPDYVFKIHHCVKNDSLFRRRIGEKGIISGFHGSRVENFYSILNFGLQQHFSSEKETIFGKGIYFSSELSISAHFSPYGQTWKRSSLGNSHSIIAVCDIINDIDKVKCRDSIHKRRSINANSIGEIPEKYIVVTDNEMVQLKYLMVYKKKLIVKSFLNKNIYWMSLVLYFLMLIFIGSKGNFWRKMMNFIFCDLITL
ncbi:protein mono-ADP-ribosyltransferase PARP16-like [Coccinella septempunctata]|uniref:protein mono-ADP-ribosyltransferase PARP16-like n=1 Tax=Coccinella septempunctata TaxID=41139 RepID=UPI001D07EF6E|nr:protein mono-ADP-ribosyltransferase PARP16-like [Coccinella septempunctata]XP_044764682.1 protein mono-ADP-ribosyltransferase PARP16-like [Coccinella septempunctata]